MRLVGDVDADPLELGASRRMIEPTQARQVAVAGDGHGHEVGHQAARGEQAEAALAVADQPAEPGDDLLLDEGRRRAAVPDVHALVGDLREVLPDDG